MKNKKYKKWYSTIIFSFSHVHKFYEFQVSTSSNNFLLIKNKDYLI